MPRRPPQHRHKLTEAEVMHLREMVGFTGRNTPAEEAEQTRQENRTSWWDQQAAIEKLAEKKKMKNG